MEYPCVSLQTNERTSFLWGDGFEGVTDAELETLHQKARDTLLSLQAEYEKRQFPASSPPRGIGGQCDSLHKGFNTIEVLERLDDKAAEHVEASVKILITEQSIRPLKIYRAFLHDVLRHCGPELVLLCAACLGKPKIVSLKAEDRVSLLNYMKAKKLSFSSPVLGRLATEYDIPQSSMTKGIDAQWHESSLTGPEKGKKIEDGRVAVQRPYQDQPSQQSPLVSNDTLNATTIQGPQVEPNLMLSENQQGEAPGANGK